MRARLASRKLLTAVIALAGLGHAAAAFGQSSNEVEVFAYDEYIGEFTNNPPSIPASLRRDAQKAYDAHKKAWGETPIQTFYNNKPVIFLTNDNGLAAATTGNHVPYELMKFDSITSEYTSKIYDLSIRSRENVCKTRGQKNWCSGNHKSVWVREAQRKLHDWKIPMLLSHEFINLWQNKWWSIMGQEAAPHWLYEGTANGWGYGLMEGVDPFQRNFLAQRLADAGSLSEFAFFLGLRYYDAPLDVDRAIKFYPTGHPGYTQNTNTTRRYNEIGLNRCRDIGLKETPGCRIGLQGKLTPEQRDQMNRIDVRWAHEHVAMAGYMTGSFYRHMLLGRPSGAKAVEVMMKRATPADRFADQRQQKRLLSWMNWLDEGIRAYQIKWPEGAERPVLPDGSRITPKGIPIWPHGVRQIYSEMIAELADFPDTTVKNRRGYLNSRVYDSLLWSKGCPQIDLTGPAKAQSFTDVGLDIISARCLRVKVARNTGSTASGSQTPSGFVVTVTHRADQDRKPTPRDEGLACIDLELASRGQVVRSPQMVTWTDKDTGKRHCSIQWVVPFDPLAPATAGGNQGYQTVLLINASEKATQTIRRRVDVSIVQAQTDVKGNLVGTPEAKGDEQRPRKRIPIPQRTELQPLPAAVSFRSGGEDENCDPYLRRVFKCGPTMKIGLMTGDANRLMQGTMNLATAYQKFDLRPGSSMADLGNVMAGGMTDAIADLTAQIARMQQSAAPPEGLAIDIIMAPVEFGQSGTFPARVVVNWSDGRDAGVLESLGPRGAGVFANGCLDDTNPPSQASVTIARHAPGIMIGTLAARLYERNEGDDACQRPYLEAGTLTASFATTGQLPALVDNGGTSQIDTRPIERHMLEQMAMVAEMMEGAGAFGAGPGAGAGGRRGSGGVPSAADDPPATVGTNALCPAPGDVEAYLTMLIGQMTRAGVGRQEAEQMRTAYRELPPETLREAVCDWVAQGRPQ